MKRRFVCCSIAAWVASAGIGSAMAQGAASAPQQGMGMGMRGHRMNAENTPGWSMMSRAERDEHRRKMMAMNHRGECMTYMEQHHAQMTARANERGRAAPKMPRRDPCAQLKP